MTIYIRPLEEVFCMQKSRDGFECGELIADKPPDYKHLHWCYGLKGERFVWHEDGVTLELRWASFGLGALFGKVRAIPYENT